MDNKTAQPHESAAAAAASDAPLSVTSTTESISTTSWIVLLVWPLVVAVGTMLWINKQGNDRLEALISSRPDLAVVDDMALIQLAIDNGADRYNPAAVMGEIEAIVKANGMGDTILLSRSMIMYAPEANRLDVRATPEPVQRRDLIR